MNNNPQNERLLIDEMSADMTIYLEPNLLKEEYQHLMDTSKIDVEAIKKYRQLLSNVKYAWQKVVRYKVFFAEFYTETDTIDDVEALNHHIHAYLQDLDTLKNKIMHMLGELRKDVKAIASNKDDVEDFVEAAKQKTLKVFDGALKHRRSHVHNGMRFMDGELLKAENAHEAIKMATEGLLAEMMNPEYRDKWVEELKVEKAESLEKAKSHWVEMATNNDVQTTGYLETFLGFVRPSLNQFLGITPMFELIGKEKHE